MEFIEQFLEGRGLEVSRDGLHLKEDDGQYTIETTDLTAFTVLGMHSHSWGCANRDGYWVVAMAIDERPVELVLKVRIREHDGQREERFSDLALRLA